MDLATSNNCIKSAFGRSFCVCVLINAVLALEACAPVRGNFLRHVSFLLARQRAGTHDRKDNRHGSGYSHTIH